MKRMFVQGSLVLCFLFAFVANSNANGNQQMQGDSTVYQVEVNFVWDDSGDPTHVYQGGLSALEMNTNEEYISEGYYGSHTFYLPEGIYRIDGENDYWWGVISQYVFINCDQTITVRLWSE